MKVSEKLLHMLKHHEGVRYKPYRDVVGLWTVGVGHLMYPEQARLPNKNTAPQGYTGMLREEFQLKPEDNRTFSEAEVDDILKKDIARFEAGVLRLCPNNLTQSRFDALCSISFNFGLGNLQRSTIRMKHNRGDIEGAAEAFMMWTKSGGREYPGLVKRRKEERALYLS